MGREGRDGSSDILNLGIEFKASKYNRYQCGAKYASSSSRLDRGVSIPFHSVRDCEHIDGIRLAKNNA